MPPGNSSEHHEVYMHDSSSDDSITTNLDQVGKLNLNLSLDISSYINKENFNLPTLPSLDLKLPSLQILSNDISNFINSYVKSSNNEERVNEVKDEQTKLDIIKTAISTRIQMNNFLRDLNLGLSLSAAVDRLQPLTDIIHETIFLPAEDSDEESENAFGKSQDKSLTEPVGVGSIVNKHRTITHEIVKPDSTTQNPPGGTRHKKTNRKMKRYSADEYDSTTFNSENDDFDGLTTEEVRDLTDLDSLDDFSKEDLLRGKIQRIHGLKNVSQGLKNKLVTRLMMGNYYKYIKIKAKANDDVLKDFKKQKLVFNPTNLEPSSLSRNSELADNDKQDHSDDMEFLSDNEDDEIIISEEDQQPTFHNPPFNTIMGCPHYQRNCKVECPICLRWYPCRFCHDQQVKDHKLVRADVKHVLCMKCNTPQVPCDSFCTSCGSELACYFCSVCKLYDNDPSKDIYHCDRCGICRLGLGLGKDYFHCDTCNICLSIDLKDKHKCVANTTHCNCPVCNEYLFTSINKVVFMKCGHLIHQHCYDELSKHTYKCPLCKKTIANVEAQFRILDQEIQQQPLPAPYNLWRCIITCNDCKGKSNVLFHILGLKCKYCKSYNTTQIKLIKPEEEEELDIEPENDSLPLFVSNATRFVEASLLSNFSVDEQSFSQEEGYFADSNRETTECDHLDGEDGQNMFGLKNLTSTLSNMSYSSGEEETSQYSISNITTRLQNFVNSVTTTNPSRPASPDTRLGGIFRSIENELDSSDADTIGGF